MSSLKKVVEEALEAGDHNVLTDLIMNHNDPKVPISHIINLFQKTIETLDDPPTIQEIREAHFYKLLHVQDPEPPELNYFEELIKLGVRINIWVIDKSTPLMYCILNNNIDFIKILLKHGAEVNKPQYIQGQDDMTPLGLAVLECFRTVVEQDYDSTEQLYQRVEFKIMKILLQHGADLMFLNTDPNDVVNEYSEVHKFLAKESAKFSFECEATRLKNLQFLQQNNQDLKKSFTSCLEELKSMKGCKLHNGFSLYDILKMRKLKLVMLVKNEDFVEAFKSGWNRESYKNYQEDLDGLFEDAVKGEQVLATETKKLHSIFKDFLPQLIIERISYFVNDYLFFD